MEKGGEEGKPAAGPGNQLGKRYRCETCGAEILCLTGGAGQFVCHDEPMKIIRLTALPASD